MSCFMIWQTLSVSLANIITVQCGRARSHIPAGVNPAPARQASYWIEDPGLAEVIPKVKHGAIKTTGRKRKLK
jgi:hypothetical protein